MTPAAVRPAPAPLPPIVRGRGVDIAIGRRRLSRTTGWVSISHSERPVVLRAEDMGMWYLALSHSCPSALRHFAAWSRTSRLLANRHPPQRVVASCVQRTLRNGILRTSSTGATFGSRRRLSANGELKGPRIVLGDFNEWMRGAVTRTLKLHLKHADIRHHLKRSRT
jgi:hypothetical protein